MNIESKYIWQNGQMIPWNESTEHSVNHALHYGTSVFEGIRFYNTDKGPKIFRLKEHIERLIYSAGSIKMELDYSLDEIMKACIDLVKQNELTDGYIRPLGYFGYGKMGLNPVGAKVNLTISAWPWGKYLSDNPISVGISNYIRLHPESADMCAKVGGYYVNSVFSNQEIKDKGFDEALLLDYKGDIAEGPGENIFFVKNNCLYTPKLGTILPGITRKTIIQIAKEKLGMEVFENTINPIELNMFDEAFFVGTAAEVTLIGSITTRSSEKIEFKNDVSRKVKELYDNLVHGRLDEYKNWLS